VEVDDVRPASPMEEVSRGALRKAIRVSSLMVALLGLDRSVRYKEENKTTVAATCFGNNFFVVGGSAGVHRQRRVVAAIIPHAGRKKEYADDSE